MCARDGVSGGCGGARQRRGQGFAMRLREARLGDCHGRLWWFACDYMGPCQQGEASLPGCRSRGLGTLRVRCRFVGASTVTALHERTSLGWGPPVGGGMGGPDPRMRSVPFGRERVNSLRMGLPSSIFETCGREVPVGGGRAAGRSPLDWGRRGRGAHLGSLLSRYGFFLRRIGHLRRACRRLRCG